MRFPDSRQNPCRHLKLQSPHIREPDSEPSSIDRAMAANCASATSPALCQHSNSTKGDALAIAAVETRLALCRSGTWRGLRDPFSTSVP